MKFVWKFVILHTAELSRYCEITVGSFFFALLTFNNLSINKKLSNKEIRRVDRVGWRIHRKLHFAKNLKSVIRNPKWFDLFVAAQLHYD